MRSASGPFPDGFESVSFQRSCFHLRNEKQINTSEKKKSFELEMSGDRDKLKISFQFEMTQFVYHLSYFDKSFLKERERQKENMKGRENERESETERQRQRGRNLFFLSASIHLDAT